MKVLTAKLLIKDQFLFDSPANDRVIFFKLYDAHSPAMFGLILKWVKEKETAEMLLHDAFIKAWQNRKLFDAKTEIFYTWLCRLARSCYNESLKI